MDYYSGSEDELIIPASEEESPRIYDTCGDRIWEDFEKNNSEEDVYYSAVGILLNAEILIVRAGEGLQMERGELVPRDVFRSRKNCENDCSRCEQKGRIWTFYSIFDDEGVDDIEDEDAAVAQPDISSAEENSLGHKDVPDVVEKDGLSPAASTNDSPPMETVEEDDDFGDFADFTLAPAPSGFDENSSSEEDNKVVTKKPESISFPGSSSLQPTLLQPTKPDEAKSDKRLTPSPIVENEKDSSLSSKSSLTNGHVAAASAESVPPVDFDWDDSGLTNPMNGAARSSALLDIDFLSANDGASSSAASTLEKDLEDFGLSSTVSQAPSTSSVLDNLLLSAGVSAKPTKYKPVAELSLDAKALHDQL